MIKRVVLIAAALSAVLFVAGSLTLEFMVSSWLPTRGKARIVQELERLGPVRVRIEGLRYELFRGFRLDAVRVADRDTDAVRFWAPMVRIQVDWSSLLMQKLTRRAPGILLKIPGRVTADGLVWTQKPLRVSGDLAASGQVLLPASETEAVRIDARVALHHGTVEGLSVLGPISDLEASARLRGERLDIEPLLGTALGSRWKLEGTLQPLTRPSMEILLSGEAELAPLMSLAPELQKTWQPTGTITLRSVCRGPLVPRPTLDCMTLAEAGDVTLRHPKLADLIVVARAQATDECLVAEGGCAAHRLTIDHLETRIKGQTLTTRGEVFLSEPRHVVLHLQGDLPLKPLNGWLPAEGPLKNLEGQAAVELHVDGPPDRLWPTGRIELQDAQAEVFAKTVDRVTGTVILNRDRVSLEHLTLRVDQQPLTGTAVITPSAGPGVVATIRLPHSQLAVTAHLTPEDVVLETARLLVNRTRVDLEGRISRSPRRASRLRASGVVALEELPQVPFVSLPPLEAWKLQGLVEVEAQLEGAWAAWQDAELDVRLRADTLGVRGVPVERMTGTLEQHVRLLRLRVPSALVSEGTLTGEFILNSRGQQPDYLFQGVLVSLQLAALAQISPAWRGREVSGSASAHAMLSGLWAQRPTWRGNGWLNASGQGLGEIPLLDKVFGGLFRALANRLGLETLRRAQLTQASFQWQLARERISTEDFRLAGLAGTEPIAIYAKGQLGLDGTLDFIVEPELSEGVILQAPNTSVVGKTILKAAGGLERLRRMVGRHRLTGTVAHPEYAFEFNLQELLKGFFQASPGDLLQGVLEQLR